MPPILTFTSTIHDPENRLERLIDEVGGSLLSYFKSGYVAVTPKTHPDIIRRLSKEGYLVVRAGDSVVSTYQAALMQPLRKMENRLMYCDLDRALHWVKTYSKEFGEISGTRSENDFILLGRSERAFSTHPETQTITEGIANRIASKELGFQETRDVLGTTWILKRELAHLALERANTTLFGFYIDWPITFWLSAKTPLYTECEGLEWETPDRYAEEIRTQGYTNWKAGFQNVHEWKRRADMLQDFIVSITAYNGAAQRSPLLLDD